jgi:hypothetical protein
MPHSTGTASATTAKAAVTRRICKPEESYVHHCSHSRYILAQ